uniref:Uncharacterized protein n=1 Tax=Knipowitschia caucasica TaxID=637954 RepID=A0AAV2KB44_KNICA
MGCSSGSRQTCGHRNGKNLSGLAGQQDEEEVSGLEEKASTRQTVRDAEENRLVLKGYPLVLGGLCCCFLHWEKGFVF